MGNFLVPQKYFHMEISLILMIYIIVFLIKDKLTGLSVVTHTFNPSAYLRGRGK